MPPRITVLIPVLDRPARVRPLLKTLDGTPGATPLFLCSQGDDLEIAAVKETGAKMIVVPWPATRGDYAKKMNLGFREAKTPFVFFGADDLSFRPGWDKAALATFKQTGACVIGTNDLGNNRVRTGRHSTHSLVHRDYLECGTVDEDGIVFHEGYWHNFVDDEFVGTARDRGTFAFAEDAHIEHLHPNWGKGKPDSTYEKGMAAFELDRALYNQRRGLWGGRHR